VNHPVLIPIIPILGLMFVAFKLSGTVTWPWVWVLAPFWAPLVLGLLIVGLVFLFIGAANWASRRR